MVEEERTWGTPAAADAKARAAQQPRNDAVNRGVVHGNRGQLDLAIADCSAAIVIRHALRAELEPQGQWQVQLRNDLANTLCYRHALLESAGRPSEAKSDLVAAIGTLEQAIEVATPYAARQMRTRLAQWQAWLREM